MPDSTGDAAQTRKILDQAIEATIIKMRETERPKVEIPGPLKWAAIILSALMTTGVCGLCFWIVSTLSEVQLAVREVNTQLSTKGAIEARFSEIDRRVSKLETYHSGGSK
jgi:hypothetical protein